MIANVLNKIEVMLPEPRGGQMNLACQGVCALLPWAGFSEVSLYQAGRGSFFRCDRLKS